MTFDEVCDSYELVVALAFAVADPEGFQQSIEAIESALDAFWSAD